MRTRSAWSATRCSSASAVTTRSPSTDTAGCTRPMKLQGLLPTDWYPVQVQPDPQLAAGDDRRHQRQGHRRPGAAVDDQQGPVHGSGGGERHRPQHLRRHRQRDGVPAARPQRYPAGDPDGLHRQRLGADQADQPGRLRHRAEGHPGPPRRSLADQAHRRHHPGEPHLRPGPRRSRRGQRRSGRRSVRGADHAERARSGLPVR